MAQFQYFDDTTSPSQGPAHVARLRTEMARRGLDGFIVPRADEHQGEYVPRSAERLAWLTGFTGSAGTAVVLRDKAALVVDGRYTVQAAEQVDTSVITPVQLAETSVEDWIAANLPEGAILAYDPWLHTQEGLKRLEQAAERAGGTLAPVDMNLIDVIWIDRPAPPQAPVRPHPLEHAGEDAASKLERIRRKMAGAKLDALVISDPHNLAWAFNLRGGDVGHTPLPLGYAILPREGRASLFFDPAKVTNEAGAAVGDLADFAPVSSFPEALDGLGRRGGKIRVDSATGAVALIRRIEAAGGAVDGGADPIALMKAVKNQAEIAGSRAAHLRDGVAVARFLAWLDREAQRGATEPRLPGAGPVLAAHPRRALEGVDLLLLEPMPRGHVERLADREQADRDHHRVDAVEQLGDAQGEPGLAGLEVDADQPDRETEEEAGEAARERVADGRPGVEQQRPAQQAAEQVARQVVHHALPDPDPAPREHRVDRGVEAEEGEPGDHRPREQPRRACRPGQHRRQPRDEPRRRRAREHVVDHHLHRPGLQQRDPGAERRGPGDPRPAAPVRQRVPQQPRVVGAERPVAERRHSPRTGARAPGAGAARR